MNQVDSDPSVLISATFSTLLITVVVSNVIRSVGNIILIIIIIIYCRDLARSGRTFINALVLLDCLVSFAHIPILAQQVWYDTQQQKYKPLLHAACNPLSRLIQDCAWLCMAEACYSMIVTTINRSLPVCIAVYRCSYVSTLR